ncbi:hypothetical protein [Sphingobium sp. WCS2017Hpa-17]|uniref:hypothetical protein n=1 Tax=Sphingobium sp. WCS2017Hpa-17 TaxID=3073638 RepID=UPI00288AF2F4|nr:hypothetical protein [Sphingobium sp. WCS2017Hpa-17]
MMSDDDTVISIRDHFEKARKPQKDERGRTIEIRPDALHAIASEAEAALIDAGAPFYVRGAGGIVRPVIDEVAAADGKRTKVARLTQVSAIGMVDYMSRSAHWVKYNQRKKDLVPTDPTAEIASIILNREGEWLFPVIAGVITTPTLKPDGTILSTPGYDPQTRLLLVEPPKLPPIPSKPSRDDALAALRTLNDLLVDFPFVDQTSHSVALSALITPVARGAMAVAPMHVTSAPTPGSGKSYIIDLASCISTGEPAPVIAAAPKEDETEKRLVAALIGGQAIISIDNVNGQLGGDLLCQMIERPVVQPRILGSSKLVKIESRATCFATGNNIHLVGDMTRRAVVCMLDPGVERPELRRFKSNPRQTVMANRGKYIAAALTVVRAYAAAGHPDPAPALASFEEWSKVVRSALIWLGCEDPCASMEAARGDDPVTSSLRLVFGTWHSAVGDSWKTSAEIKQVAESRMFDALAHPHLNEALKEIAEDKRGDIGTRQLGKFLIKYKDRVVNGMKLQSKDDGHANVKLWSVRKLQE